MSILLHPIDQNGSPVEEFAGDFLELAFTVYLDDDMLMFIFHRGLDELFRSRMSWDVHGCTLEQYILCALLLSRTTPERLLILPVIPESNPESAPVQANLESAPIQTNPESATVQTNSKSTPEF